MNYTHVIYHVIFEGTRYSSVKQDYEEVKDQVYHLSEHGTNGLKVFKIPVTDNKFVIFSEEQIKKTLIEVELIEEAPQKKTRKKTEPGMIKS